MINEYLKEHFNIDSAYEFKRDYINKPLLTSKNGIGSEYPDYDDFYYLYITLNLTLNEISKLFNVKPSRIKRYANYLHITKSNKLRTLNSYNHSLINNKHIFQTNEFKEQVKKHNQEKYGANYHQQTNNWKNKIKQISLDKYGVSNVAQSNIVKQKIKNTNKEKYGSEYFTQTQEYKNLYKNTVWNNNIQKKKLETSKMNNNYGNSISKEEKSLFNIIKSKYPQTIQQYYSNQYPFKCDFYIPEIDTYIEYQGWWGHGLHKYDCNNDLDTQKLLHWKQKILEGHISYKRAIEIWTIEDVNKRNWAISHNLNWLEFFNKQDLLNWLHNE